MTDRKKKKGTGNHEDAEAELRKNLREHERRYREQTSGEGFREYESGDEDGGQK